MIKYYPPFLLKISVIFYDKLTLNFHVTSLYKAAFYQIHHISQIRKFLNSSAAKPVVQFLVSSRLDYCNSVLRGLPDCAINKLQTAQNSAAWLVSQVKKTDHITPVLMGLHWLPIRQPIEPCMALPPRTSLTCSIHLPCQNHLIIRKTATLCPKV